ncbi:MAG: hypothetical protein K0Q55_542 [Verrucomicrobia bacterium]|nr:hypothetical protein [Verrucomicrobiota bacterium]
MRRLSSILSGCLWLLLMGLGQAAEADKPTVFVVVGAAGEDVYGSQFVKWAGHWREAATKAGASFVAVGLEADQNKDREDFQKKLAAEGTEGSGELWLVLLGHGTFDGKEAKFNLRGTDFNAEELAEWLKPIHRPMAVINTSAASAPYLPKLSLSGRVVIAATKSGYEINYARFGEYISKAIVDKEADLDKDGQTSLLEAYLMASRKVTEFYETEGRIVTEHSLMDDNGDGLGTPADWFRGVRATKKARNDAELDGFRAHQFHLVRSAVEQKMPVELRAKRDELELGINKLREKKADMKGVDYDRELEKLLVELARVYEKAGLLPK